MIKTFFIGTDTEKEPLGGRENQSASILLHAEDGESFRKLTEKLDPLYKDLSVLLSFESFPGEPLSGNDDYYLWNVHHDVATLPESEYNHFTRAVKRVRELAILSREVLYRRLICDIVNLSHPDYESFLEEMEEVRTDVLGTIKMPYVHLICDIVSLPENLYRDYLDMLEELRKHEKEIQNHGENF